MHFKIMQHFQGLALSVLVNAGSVTNRYINVLFFVDFSYRNVLSHLVGW